ncbi:hypothetical protein [Nocardioides pinisoli]|uniref:Uncharacterized protein n=1 Tax=Nocardioides pinisoli TaxID=2950279 RepID=A0ABT1KUS8_9ACTN|nr:hypothetical protein [Nocardioides pinisoli]MCP3421513.1 hypothetical protein [Nocardioides pinisoli]
MTTTLQSRTIPGTVPRASARASGLRRFVGGFYLVMGGINAGIVAADPETYRTFADGSFWPFVADTWRSVVMAHPTAWILALAAGEVALGILLLRGGPAAKVGWVGVIAFHVLLMAFGFGFWLWSVPALLLLVPVARADWPALSGPATATSPPATPPVTRTRPNPSAPAVRTSSTITTRVATWVLATAVVGASLYGLLAETPYRSLPEATVVSARAQDACSIAVAALLILLVRPGVHSTAAHLARLGLLAYLLYSYLIYVTGVPMNRVFLLYVLIVSLSGAGLLGGLRGLLDDPPSTTASPRLIRTTGWVLVVTAVLFAGLWLSTLVPYALGGSPPEPEGVGGTPYPVFVLDLAVVLPAIAAVGVLLLRRRPEGGPLAAVALLKILTLFTALWAGPVLALATDADVHLGPDAVPSLLLLAASAWLTSVWLRSFSPVTPHERSTS